MNLKNELMTKIIGIVSLVVLGYILFISVYNQIIVQNEGFFYIIIFGGILILAFVLLSLITKLFEINNDISEGFLWNVIEILLLICVAYLFITFRLCYHSSVSADESLLYRTANLLSTGELSSKGLDITGQLVKFPSEYLYAFFVSVFFRMFGASTSVIVGVNAAVLILNSFLVDRVVRKIGGKTCGVIAAICTLIIPSQSFAVYSYSGEFFFSLILLITVNCFLIVMNDNFSKPVFGIISTIALGLSIAMLIFDEPLAVFPVILLLVLYFIKRISDNINITREIIIIAASFIVFLLILAVIKTSLLQCSFSDITGAGLSRFNLARNIETNEQLSTGEIFKSFHDDLDNKNINVRDNYYFLSTSEGDTYSTNQNAWFSLCTQLSYMFVIVMCIACSFYYVRNKNGRITPLLMTLLGVFITLFFKSSQEPNTYLLFEILICIGSCGLHYMYENHHPEIYMEPAFATSTENYYSAEDEYTDEESLEDNELALAKARAIIFGDYDFTEDEEPAYYENDEYDINTGLNEEVAMADNEYADNYNSNSAAEEISNEDDYFADYENNNNSLTSIAFETESDEKPIEMTTSAPFEEEEPIEKAPVKVSTKDVDPKDIVTYVGEDGKVHKKIVRKVKKKVPSKQTEIKAADTKEVEPKTEVKKVSIKDVDPKDIVTYIGEDGKVHKKIVRKVKKSAATAGAVPVNKDKTTADNETVATKEVSYVDENGVVRKKIIKTVKRNVPKTSTSNSLLKSSNEILEPVTDTKEIAKEEKSIVAKPSTTEAVKKSDGEVITYMGEDGKLHKKIVRKVKKPVVKDAANKVVEKSSEKPIEKAVETTIDKPVTKSVNKPVEKTVVKPTKESTEKSLVQSVNKQKIKPDEKPLMNKLGIDTDIPVSKPKGIIKETGTGNFKNTKPVKRENIEFDSPLPGEPFELPLPGPKKHTKKYLDFDHETDDNADYSFTIEI